MQSRTEKVNQGEAAKQRAGGAVGGASCQVLRHEGQGRPQTRASEIESSNASVTPKNE